MSREETMHTADSAVPESEPQAPNDVRAEAPSPENIDGVAQKTTKEDNSLAEQLAAANKKAQENMDGWQRAMADFQNYKRRSERELKDSYQKASVDMLMNMLPIIDDFERAMANVPEDLRNHSWLNGVNLIQRKFNKLLDEQGVVTIDPVGEVFDPSRHEAVGADDSSEYESGYVTATLQKGYMNGDRVLRPALVRVAN